MVDVLVDVDVLVLVLVLVVVDVVLVLVLVLVVVDVLVVIADAHSQLFPEYRHQAFCAVSQYSSPTSGAVGGVAETRIFPVMLVMCVSAI